MLGSYSWLGNSVCSSTPKLKFPVSSNCVSESSASGSAVCRNSWASSSRSVTFAPMGSPSRMSNSPTVRFAFVRTGVWPVISVMMSSALARSRPPWPIPMWTTTFSMLGSRISWKSAESASLLIVITREVLVDDDDVLFDRLEALALVLRDEDVVLGRARRDLNLVDGADFARVGAVDGGDQRALFVLEVGDDVARLVVDDDGVAAGVLVAVLDDERLTVVEAELDVATGDVGLVDDLPELGLGGVGLDGRQRQPSALAGEDAVVLLALGEGHDVEHTDGPFLVGDRLPVDQDVVLVERVARFLAVVGVAQHVPQDDEEGDPRLTVRAGTGLDRKRCRLALDGPAVWHRQALLMVTHAVSSSDSRRASRRSSSVFRSVTRTFEVSSGRGTSSPSVVSRVTSSTWMTASCTSTVSPALTRTLRWPYSSRRSADSVARTCLCRSCSGASRVLVRCLSGCCVIVTLSSS